MKSFIQTVGSFFAWTVGAVVVLFCAGVLISLLAIVPYHTESPTDDWRYRQIEAADTTGFPVSLEALGVDPLEYYYTRHVVFDMPFADRSRYIESFADDAEAARHVVTLQYQVWESHLPFLLSWKEYLLRGACGTRTETIYDYGAKETYWLGNHLLLRYDGAVALFYIGDDAAEKSLLDSERAATLIRESFPGK